MKILTKAVLTLSLVAGSVEAKSSLFDIYDILGIEHEVGNTEFLEENQDSVAVYISAPYDRIEIRHKTLFQSKADYFRTILHELTHWTGGERGRSSRYNPETDEFVEEVIAEYTAVLLSRDIYGGKYEYTKEEADGYLYWHPLSKELTQEQTDFVISSVQEAYEIIMEKIKKLDTENKLGVQ